MNGPERQDPWGGAWGAAFAVRAGGFVFTSDQIGVVAMEEGVPRCAETFDEQLRLTGTHISDRLAHFGYTASDIVDASVTLHPDVNVDPGEFLDLLQEYVLAGGAPALSVARAAPLFDGALLSVKVTAYRPA